MADCGDDLKEEQKRGRDESRDIFGGESAAMRQEGQIKSRKDEQVCSRQESVTADVDRDHGATSYQGSRITDQPAPSSQSSAARHQQFWLSITTSALSVRT